MLCCGRCIHAEDSRSAPTCTCYSLLTSWLDSWTKGRSLILKKRSCVTRTAFKIGGTRPYDTVAIKVLRRLASPDEPLRPRRTFLAAFACFGAHGPSSHPVKCLL
eukprot:2152087-Amphidinium_carterae.1